MVARWPIVLWALVSVLLQIERPYMITPKGVSAGLRRSVLVHGPLLGFATVALAGIWLSDALSTTGPVGGYVLLVLVNALVAVVAAGTVLLLELRARAVDGSLAARMREPIGALAWLGALVVALGTTAVLYWDSVLAGVS